MNLKAEIWKLSPNQFLNLLTKNSTPIQTKELLKIRFENDIKLFAKTLFPNLCRLPFNKLHNSIFKHYSAYIHEELPGRAGYNLAVAAPRGAAKSTLISLILPLHSLIYKKEKYIVLISSTLKQARQRLKNIKNEILTNQILKDIYGDLSRPAEKWNESSIIVNNMQVDVYSAGTEIRGISLGDYRPTKIILDDAESSEGAETSESRDKIAQWFSEVVENLGDKYTRLEVIGTILHKDSLLSSLLRRPDFKTMKFKSIERFSPETTLWNSWKEIFTNLSDADRGKHALEFFEKK